MKNSVGAANGNSENDGLQEAAAELELKKQSHSANMNLISYQTANFGPNGETRPIGKDREETPEEAEEEAPST